MPQWKGLFDWSMQYQDGTKPTDFSAVEANPEKIKWCERPMRFRHWAVAEIQLCLQTAGPRSRPPEL